MAILGLSSELHEVEWVLKFFDLKLQTGIFFLKFFEFFGEERHLDAQLCEVVIFLDVGVEGNASDGDTENETDKKQHAALGVEFTVEYTLECSEFPEIFKSGNLVLYHSSQIKKMSLELTADSCKKTNSCGLQIADLVAHPIARHVVRPEQPSIAFEIVKKKLLGYPKHMGTGLKCFP